MQSMLSLKRYLFTGGFGFCLVSLLVFATVAFAERWMYENLTVYGAYLTWTVLFIGLGGSVLKPLAKSSVAANKFHLIFGLGFFMYAVGWIAAYFLLRGVVGEWVGSFAGSILMALVFAKGFKVLGTFASLSAILFTANSCGYFLGSVLNNTIGGKIGMMLWGVAYGLFLGAGLGAVLYVLQSHDGSEVSSEKRRATVSD